MVDKRNLWMLLLAISIVLITSGCSKSAPTATLTPPSVSRPLQAVVGTPSPVVDTMPPLVFLGISPDMITVGAAVTVTVTAKDDGSVVHTVVAVDGETVQEADTDSLVAVWQPSRPGPHRIVGEAIDAAGNKGTTLAIVIAVAATPAVSPAEVLPPSPTPSSTPSPTQVIPTPTPTLTGTPTVAPTSTATPTSTSTPTVTSAPPKSPTPTPTLVPLATVAIYESIVTIPTYPFYDHLRPWYDERYNWTFLMLDRAAYEAIHPQPQSQEYRVVVLENEYLRLTVLPDVGGRVYECIFKPTGHNELYRNSVLKPSPWGPGPEQGVPGDLSPGWLAVGGIEWDLPVAEHGYSWGVPWGYIIVPEDHQATVTVYLERETEKGKRLQPSVDITLRAGESMFHVYTRLNNPTDQTQSFQYWANAMLAPGAGNHPSADLQFIIPGHEMTVHSTGDKTLPGPREAFSWPVYQGRDLSRLGNWDRWLGFFARPQAQDDFAGVYDHSQGEGMVHIFPSDLVQGVKVFGFGWRDPISPDNYTDDGSAYVELHSGLSPTFWDQVTLSPGKTLAWEEAWYPIAETDGFVYATRDAALNLRRTGETLEIVLFPTHAIRGTVGVSVAGQALAALPVDLQPASPFTHQLQVPVSGPVAVQLVSQEGDTLLAYQE